jgi:capsular polysaccharide biosynthesis protein
MAFKDQVTLMSETDVLITVHGAAIANGKFMKKG